MSKVKLTQSCGSGCGDVVCIPTLSKPPLCPPSKASEMFYISDGGKTLNIYSCELEDWIKLDLSPATDCDICSFEDFNTQLAKQIKAGDYINVVNNNDGSLTISSAIEAGTGVNVRQVGDKYYFDVKEYTAGTGISISPTGVISNTQSETIDTATITKVYDIASSDRNDIVYLGDPLSPVYNFKDGDTNGSGDKLWRLRAMDTTSTTPFSGGFFSTPQFNGHNVITIPASDLIAHKDPADNEIIISVSSNTNMDAIIKPYPVQVGTFIEITDSTGKTHRDEGVPETMLRTRSSSIWDSLSYSNGTESIGGLAGASSPSITRNFKIPYNPTKPINIHIGWLIYIGGTSYEGGKSSTMTYDSKNHSVFCDGYSASVSTTQKLT